MKEKYEVILDSRQVRQLIVGAVLALSAVFGGGYYVGQRTQAVATVVTSPEADPLAMLDERAQKLEEVKADAALTFQDELTRQRPPEVFAEPAQLAPARVVVQPASGGAGLTEPLPAPAPVAVKREPPPREAPLVKESLANTAVTTRTGGGENALREALARASQRGAPETDSAGGTFTLQLAASPSREEADRFAANLRERGYAPYIVEAHVEGKGTFFRVRMGRFPSKDAAQRYLGDFKRETSLSAFVAPAN